MLMMSMTHFHSTLSRLVGVTILNVGNIYKNNFINNLVSFQKLTHELRCHLLQNINHSLYSNKKTLILLGIVASVDTAMVSTFFSTGFVSEIEWAECSQNTVSKQLIFEHGKSYCTHSCFCGNACNFSEYLQHKL